MIWLPDSVDPTLFTAADTFNLNQVNDINTFNHDTITQANTMIEQFATKPATKADYAYMGNTGDTISSADLVQIIKDYYKLT